MSNENHRDVLYVLRSQHEKGLVLDGTDPCQIRIQHFTGFRNQLWKLEEATSLGAFYIVNDATGTALSVSGEKQLCLKYRDGSLTQQWMFTWQGYITNVGRVGFNVDILNEQYKPGVIVQLWRENGCLAQKFVRIQKV